MSQVSLKFLTEISSVFNLILPCVLITGIALMSFYMPPDSGEKVSTEQCSEMVVCKLYRAEYHSTLIVSSVNCVVLADRSTEV